MKTGANKQESSGTTSNTYDVQSPFCDSSTVKVINDFGDDLLFGKLNGRGTGLTGGYTSSIGQTAQAVLPTYAGWNGFVALPDPVLGTGASNIQMASSSAQDAAAGTGIYQYIVFYLDLQKSPHVEFVTLTGTTPVTLAAKNVYHFQFAFPAARGSGFAATGLGTVTANVGTVWLGIGAFAGATGFATSNYMWNRPGDGFLSSTIYCVPSGKMGTLWSVKFNSDTAVACSFKTYSRSDRNSPWSLNAEDNVTTGTSIQRTLAGGFMPAGGEFTVIANKTTAAANIACNFVMTLYEASVKVFSQGNPNF
jgi:hypothetical protein